MKHYAWWYMGEWSNVDDFLISNAKIFMNYSRELGCTHHTACPTAHGHQETADGVIWRYISWHFHSTPLQADSSDRQAANSVLLTPKSLNPFKRMQWQIGGPSFTERALNKLTYLCLVYHFFLTELSKHSFLGNITDVLISNGCQAFFQE